ncbi:MAG: hypothetical protein AB7G06_03165 [Bdellovibrionales bacterium]
MTATLRQIAPALYFSLFVTPDGDRARLLALYALECELLQIPQRVTQPTLGVMRVTWWRDALLTGDTSSQLVRDVLQHFPGQSQVLAAFTETFTAPFEPDNERPALLHQRGALRAQLVGNSKAVRVITGVEAIDETSPFFWFCAGWTTFKIGID